MPLRTKQLPKNRPDNHRFWQHHVRQQARGKPAQHIYCEQHGLGHASFTRWQGLLGIRPKPEAPVVSTDAFIPAQVQMSKGSSGRTTGGGAGSIALVLPCGMRIEGITSANIDLAATLAARS